VQGEKGLSRCHFDKKRKPIRGPKLLDEMTKKILPKERRGGDMFRSKGKGKIKTIPGISLNKVLEKDPREIVVNNSNGGEEPQLGALG